MSPCVRDKRTKNLRFIDLVTMDLGVQLLENTK